MSIQEMKFIGVAGQLKDFDKIVVRYAISSNIQFERAIDTIKDRSKVNQFIEENPYEDVMSRLNDINEYMGVSLREFSPEELEMLISTPFNTEKVYHYADTIEKKIKEHNEKISLYNQKASEREQIKKQLIPILDLDIDMQNLFHLDFIKFRFGKLSKDNYKKLNMYVKEADFIVVPAHEGKDEVWISYFMPVTYAKKVDDIFASLYFERVRLSDKIEGNPRDVLNKVNKELEEIRQKIQEAEKEFKDYLDKERKAFSELYHKVGYLHKALEVKKYAIHTKEAFYITGWIPKKDLGKLIHELDKIKGIVYTVEKADNITELVPPTKLENNKFFKPFETIITMYGLPSHHEIDPTVIVALSYILMFGAMFGDVGQGAVLAFVGWLIAKKGNSLGRVLVSVGISSMLFGFIYGSVFSSEEIIKTPIFSPLHNINTLLYMSVGFGVFMVFLALTLNIINCIRAKDYGKLLFDKNGIAGFLFYSGLVFSLLYLVLKGKFITSVILIILFFVLPLLAMFFKEPLKNIIGRKKNIFPEDKGGYFVEGFFELFETILGFLSNTISFVRVGAFALNHAGLSLAIWTLYDMAKGGGGFIVIILGNILIIGLEGLIVGIQCLRIQYYEMFSHFFQGEGRQFKPLKVDDRYEK